MIVLSLLPGGHEKNTPYFFHGLLLLHVHVFACEVIIVLLGIEGWSWYGKRWNYTTQGGTAGIKDDTC